MNIRPLESLTKEELIELVKLERESPDNGIPEIPFCEQCGDGIVAHNPGICGTCYATNMPHPDHIPDVGKMGAPTDTQMLDWLIENDALICHSVTNNSYEIWFGIDNVETGKTAREAIINAMRGEK